MPNGPKKWNPQIVGSKPIANMNVVDRNGLGRLVISLARDQKLGVRKISEYILKELQIFIGWRSIAFYLTTFRNNITGELPTDDQIPNIPDFDQHAMFRYITQDVRSILEERQVDDITALESIMDQEMSWFSDPLQPMGMKLRVAKELRETIKLKLELGGVVKPASPVTNNTLVLDSGALEKLLVEKPELVPALRELLYALGNKKEQLPAPITEQPAIEVQGSVVEASV